VCVKANLKVMILLITVRDHLVQVFARIDDFNFTSAKKIPNLSMTISIFFLIKRVISITKMRKRIHNFFFPVFLIFVLLISHARLPLRSQSNQSYTRTHISLRKWYFCFFPLDISTFHRCNTCILISLKLQINYIS
jgi:hypothetical protein